MLTEQETDNLLQSGALYINGEIRWKLKNGRSHFEFRLKVDGSPHSLELIATRNLSIASRYSFALLLDGKRIRGLDPNSMHINHYPKREKIKGIHKHKWKDECQDSFAYIPDDITTTDIEEAFLAFIRDCNIRFDGTFVHPPPFQPELLE